MWNTWGSLTVQDQIDMVPPSVGRKPYLQGDFGSQEALVMKAPSVPA